MPTGTPPRRTHARESGSWKAASPSSSARRDSARGLELCEALDHDRLKSGFRMPAPRPCLEGETRHRCRQGRRVEPVEQPGVDGLCDQQVALVVDACHQVAGDGQPPLARARRAHDVRARRGSGPTVRTGPLSDVRPGTARTTGRAPLSRVQAGISARGSPPGCTSDGTTTGAPAPQTWRGWRARSPGPAVPTRPPHARPCRDLYARPGRSTARIRPS